MRPGQYAKVWVPLHLEFLGLLRGSGNTDLDVRGITFSLRKGVVSGRQPLGSKLPDLLAEASP